MATEGAQGPFVIASGYHQQGTRSGAPCTGHAGFAPYTEHPYARSCTETPYVGSSGDSVHELAYLGSAAAYPLQSHHFPLTALLRITRCFGPPTPLASLAPLRSVATLPRECSLGARWLRIYYGARADYSSRSALCPYALCISRHYLL